MNNPVLTKYILGDIELKNRLVMAPMTRSRSFVDNIPHELAPLYYSQRASAGLIITEGTQVSPNGIGYLWTPGNYSKAQQEMWQKVTDAVHEKDGIIFNQLWHTGRISHSSLRPDNLPPLAPSDIKPNGKVYTSKGWVEYETPRIMTKEDINQAINEFKIAAENAKLVGFDGVDIHGAFGYLIDQFICSGTNKRNDEYGGSLENRLRFALEVVEAVLKVWSSKRVGIKLSPANIYNDMHDDNPKETFAALIEKLNDYDLAYIMLMEPQTDVSNLPNYPTNVIEYFRPFYKGNLIANAGLTKAKANYLIENNIAQLVAFGSLFLANPDLPKRFELDAPLNKPNQRTYYGGNEVGYIDYPFLSN